MMHRNGLSIGLTQLFGTISFMLDIPQGIGINELADALDIDGCLSDNH